MSHRQNPSCICLVLICRFHSFLEVNAEPQLYWAKQHGNGRILGPVVLPSAGLGAGGIGSGGLASGSFVSICLLSAVLISIGFKLGRFGFGSARTGVGNLEMGEASC
jgi:hypothetical protein